MHMHTQAADSYSYKLSSFKLLLIVLSERDSYYKMMLSLLLSFYTISSILQGCYGQTIINLANGIYSTKVESDGLHLPSTSIFKPIAPLTIQLHLTSSYSVFVNYQITVDGSAHFWTKLQISRDDDDDGLTNAGSLVHYGNQAYKTATGYWMDNLEPGHYTFEVHYQSSSSISVEADKDYQTAILQVMWFADAHAVSDGVRCYPRPCPLNKYSVLSPIKDLKVSLLVPSGGRVVVAGYQLAIYSSSNKWFTARLHMNNDQLKSTVISQGNNYYFNLNSFCMDYLKNALYEFGLTYRNLYNSYFEDCRNNYQGNKNLYAMYLLSTCRRLVSSRYKYGLPLSTIGWKTTDLNYTIRLSQTEHVIVRYQYSASGRNTYTINRLLIDSVPVKHTASITGNAHYAGNSGMWQGGLSSGIHTIAVEHRSGNTYTHHESEFNVRAVDIISCY